MAAEDEGVRLPILSVLGPGAASHELEDLAERVGGLAATRGWVVLTGGGPGVMAAACRGAVHVGGVTVGVLPVAAPQAGYPNPWVRIALFTGAGSARNVFNVLSGDLCLALGGGPGTLSEIALALKAGRELWCYHSWGLTPPRERTMPAPRTFDDEDDLLGALAQRLGRG